MNAVQLLAIVITGVLLLIYKTIFKCRTFTGGGEGKVVIDLEESRALINNPLTAEIIDHANVCVTYDDIPHELKYIQTDKTLRIVAHNGQIKLFLTEIQFVTDCLKSHLDKAIVMYAGSAPCNKLSYLTKIFPNVKWLLCDPNEHYVKYYNKDQYDYVDTMLYFVAAGNNANRSSPGYNMRRQSKFPDKRINLYGKGPVARQDEKMGSVPENILSIILEAPQNIFVIEDYCSADIAALIAPATEHMGLYFISDIRSNDESEDFPSNMDIIWNSAQMYNWLSVLKPSMFMIKFRCPYTISERDKHDLSRVYKNNTYMHEELDKCPIKFVDNFLNGKFIFIKPSHINIQAFAGPSSTESRLIGNTLDLHEFNILEYEQKFFYYNRIHRPYGWHDNPYADNTIGLDHCGDCALMVHIFETYKSKYALDINVREMVGDVLKIIGRDLSGDGHGYYFVKYKSLAATLDRQDTYIILSKLKSLSRKLTVQKIDSNNANVLEYAQKIINAANDIDAEYKDKYIRYIQGVILLGLSLRDAKFVFDGGVIAKQIYNQLDKIFEHRGPQLSYDEIHKTMAYGIRYTINWTKMTKVINHLASGLKLKKVASIGLTKYTTADVGEVYYMIDGLNYKEIINDADIIVVRCSPSASCYGPIIRDAFLSNKPTLYIDSDRYIFNHNKVIGITLPTKMLDGSSREPQFMISYANIDEKLLAQCIDDVNENKYE